ncbi:hypothetical protein CUU_2196 [Phocaeicola vulgatus PC510]|uniref:Transmembrane protein n=1 Tax=Phocaeicola vulgatus PC510 TaxID=702446 RepID=D4VBE6_PHOVU|nr:hypothetical protein CUU_2196 [Phocaeicola vulgatus PC510]
MVIDKLPESILILAGYFSGVHVPARLGVFADMDFEPFPAFRLFRCATLPQGYFRIVVNLPVFTCPVMSPMFETAGCPCLEPYIACLYQYTFTAMHIAFDALFIPGHERDTGEIPEHNVISIHVIYEERPGAFIVSGNKEQAVTCTGIPVGTCLFDVFHHCVRFLYVFPDKPVHPVIPVVQADECFLAILVFVWIMVFFILWLNMPGFGKAGISFLICIRLSFALIVQGLAKKYRSEARMIFSANQSEGPPCTIRGKRLALQVRNRNAEHCLILRWKNFNPLT